MTPLTKQGVRDLDAIDRVRPYVPPTLTEHVCVQWRWFHPPKGTIEDEENQSEILCVVCRKPWHGRPTGVIPPQVKSLEKIAPSLAKPKKKAEPTTAPTLKASATAMHDAPTRRAR